MALYWVTFRIEDHGSTKPTYAERYDSFIAAIKELKTNWWVEPTSFIMFESDKSLDDIATAIKKPLLPTHDMFLLRQGDHQGGRVFGKVNDLNIFKFMPYLKK